ncbi:hypothetical protein [Flexithrix dorotheae]|uniref:hypothetical protein n=1 Tax=Flexithrix dorotheae TaxID=70993 RepID=UPI00039E182D|nr:hypothetical protein [Flexithrix dorotheae]
MLMKRAGFVIILIFQILKGFSQNSWEVSTYPDEEGFQQRMAPMMERIAAQGFGMRSLANSRCPDTGLPVKTYALKGETVISPYTGRAYVQGDTGYFGPKARNEKGKITAFGGDPMKYELPPAAASILLNKELKLTKAFLSIPGNLRQQFHFACNNWARAYPLIKNEMGEEWEADFFYWISIYTENRKPSDGHRELLGLSKPHDLVGEKGELLGGNAFDGGTENHKTMWRTSALLYSQLLPDSAKISGYAVEEARELTKEMLRDYVKKLLYVGNGEYDSNVYYPYSIEGFLNLYDFSTDAEIKALAKAALDYYFATYGLKLVDGAIAGAQKRGYLTNKNPDKMEQLQWGFFDDTSRKMENSTASLHQTTTTYRPNEIIWNITRKELKLPFEAKMSRPFYHMDKAHAFAETFYADENFAIGNIQMTIVDNPNQQMIWSVVAKGTDKPLCFSGGHPMRGSTSGHSPYTQTLQSKGTLLLLSAPTQKIQADTLIAPKYATQNRENLWILPESEQPKNYETGHRQKYGAAPLHVVEPPANQSVSEISRFWQESKGGAASWFYFPNSLSPQLIDNTYYFEANEVYLAVKPLSEKHFVVKPDTEVINKLKSKEEKTFFRTYGLISFPGEISGYVVEVVAKNEFRSLEDFAQKLAQKRKLELSENDGVSLNYKSIYGDRLEMDYQPQGLRCKGKINGKIQNWDDFTGGAIYQSPYINVGNGIMRVSDGNKSYQVDFTGDNPIWKELN